MIQTLQHLADNRTRKQQSIFADKQPKYPPNFTVQSFKTAASQIRRLESTFRTCSPAAILLVNLNLPFIKSFLSSPYIGICDGEDEAFMYCMGGEL